MVDAPREPSKRDTRGTPRWVMALGIAALIVVLFAVAVMLIAGGEHGPGRHAASNDPRGQTPASSGSATGGVGGPADAGSAVRTVSIDALDALTFEPSAIDVSEGGFVGVLPQVGHDECDRLAGRHAAMQQDHADAMAHMPDGVDHGLPNSLTLQPGETKQLTWRFGDTTIEYGCHAPGHYQAGMSGRITID